MDLNFNTNTESFGSVQGPGAVAPTGSHTHGQTQDPGASTLSHSLAEALAIQFLAGWPILLQPNNQVVGSAEDTIKTINAGFAKIGSDMWDGYLKHLADEKRRVEDYLKSPAYQHWIDQVSLKGLVNTDLKTDVAKHALMNATEFNEYATGRIRSAARLWTDAIDGVSNFVNQQRDVNVGDALFVVASFAITSTFIGNYMNVVDVASTNMVTVKPIQDAVANVLSLVPNQLQDQFALAINFLAVGLIYFSNAESIVKAGDQKQRAPTNWESITTFAKNLLEKVEGNMVSTYLMAMLTHRLEEVAGNQTQRDQVFGRLVVLAKAVMLSTAMAALLKAATPDLQLNSLVFVATLTKPLKAMSSEDEVLLQQLQPLVLAFNKLREESGMSEEFWGNLISALGDFFDRDPPVEELVDPTNVYANLVSHLFQRDLEV